MLRKKKKRKRKKIMIKWKVKKTEKRRKDKTYEGIPKLDGYVDDGLMDDGWTGRCSWKKSFILKISH